MLDSPLESINTFAEEQGLSREEALDIIVDECKRRWKIKCVKKNSVPIETCTSLMFNIGLSISQYQMLRTICLPYVHFATRNAVDVFKNNLHPVIESKEIKAAVNMGELQQQTFQAICSDKQLEGDGKFKVLGKFGLDGSGAHKIRHQSIDPEKVSNETPHLDPVKARKSIILVCYCPLQVNHCGKVVWTNPVPNSTAYARTVSLFRAKEERDVLATEVDNWTPYLNEYEANMELNSHAVNVTFNTS